MRYKINYNYPSNSISQPDQTDKGIWSSLALKSVVHYDALEQAGRPGGGKVSDWIHTLRSDWYTPLSDG